MNLASRAVSGLLPAAAFISADTGALQPRPNDEALPCASLEFRQFDFWVGEWEVTPAGAAEPIAESRIEKLYGGCAIRENWMPVSGSGAGGSLNAFVRERGVWRQIWTDSMGSWNSFEGGLVDRSMVLVGHRLSPRFRDRRVLARLTFTPGTDGSVRQLGEHSTDFGRTWDVSYDFLYTRREPE